MSQQKIKTRIANTVSRSQFSRNPGVFHGHVFSPASRAYFAWQEGKLDEGQLNQCEAGKFFPENAAGVTDSYAPTDSPNNLPPADGKIASANQVGTEFLDAPGSDWEKHDVHGGDTLDIVWAFTANHVTRRWNYFITKEGWNPDQPLNRDQFEPTPFAINLLTQQPFWEHTNELQPPTPYHYSLTLPQREGYHVLLAVWEVADTGNAFYQVVDLNFASDGGGSERPATPTGFQATEVTENTISFSWQANPPGGTFPVSKYRIVRDGKTVVDIPAAIVNWTDRSVQPGTTYSYFISAVDVQGNISLPGKTLEVTTLTAGGGDAPPGAPKSLHKMNITADSVSMMWGASTSVNPIKLYHIYRDGIEVASTASLLWSDTGLSASTRYQYFVAAENSKGAFSVPSNVLFATTNEKDDNGDAPEWLLNTFYQIDDRVTYLGNTYRCIQSHTSNSGWDPVSATTLWVKDQ